MWSNYLEEIEGLIYLVDVNREDIDQSIETLSIYFFNQDKFLDNKQLHKAQIPILILINKIVMIF